MKDQEVTRRLNAILGLNEQSLAKAIYTIVTKKYPLKVFQTRQQQIPREKFRRVQPIHVQFTVSYNEKSSRTNAEGSPRSIAEVSFVSSTISFGQPLREAVPSFRFRFPDALLVRRLDYAGI